jgi:hypothetical protein
MLYVHAAGRRRERRQGRRRGGTGEEELADWVDGGCVGIGEEQLVTLLGFSSVECLLYHTVKKQTAKMDSKERSNGQ